MLTPPSLPSSSSDESIAARATFYERDVETSDGLKLYFREYNPQGQGLPILCLSGLTRNSHDYHYLACHLAEKGRRVLAVDYRGRGRSDFDPNWRNYRPIRLLRDINGLAHDLRLKHAILIGTSLGGLLAMGLAALRPGFVSGAVINDIGPDLHSEGIPRICAYVGHDHPQENWEDAVRHMRVMFSRIGVTSDEEWQFLTEGSFKAGADGKLHVSWDPNIARTLESGAKSPLPLWLVFRAMRSIPTLVIRGGQSDVLTQPTFDRMAEMKPDLKRLVIPHAGHTPTLNEPESIAAIDDLLAGIK